MRSSLAAIGLTLFALGAPLCAASAQSLEGEPVNVIPLDRLENRALPRGYGVEIRPGRELPVAGVCLMVFDVTPEGRARWSTIEAQCDDATHVDAAKELIATRRFEAPVIDGAPQEQTGVTAELRFRSAG